jgi:hypothetical protein
MNITIWNNALRNYPDVKEWIQRNAKFNKFALDKKDFYINDLPLRYVDKITEVISQLKGGKVQYKKQFLRLSTVNQDNDVRIHSDYTWGCKYAAVLYFSTSPKWHIAEGTAFFKHKIYGHELTYEYSDIADEILSDENSIKTHWILDSIIGAKENRLLIYPTSYFHSRYPFKSWGKDKTDGRIIWVGFFDIKKEVRYANK